MKDEGVIVSGRRVKFCLLAHHRAGNEVTYGAVHPVQTEMGQVIHAPHVKIDGKTPEEDNAHGVGFTESDPDFR